MDDQEPVESNSHSGIVIATPGLLNKWELQSKKHGENQQKNDKNLLKDPYFFKQIVTENEYGFMTISKSTVFPNT